jgi:2-haloacid dehalogenase
MKNKIYRALFFDADDTLFDYQRAERNALLGTLQRHDIKGDPALLTDVYRRHNLAAWQAYERGEIDQEELRRIRFANMFAELGLVGLDPAQVADTYADALAGESHLFPGALELVRALSRAYPLALITNGIARIQNRRFGVSPILPYFSAVVISGEVGIAKPDPAIFAPALKAVGVAAGEVLYVGDGVSSDMGAANNAGIDFCWFNPAGAELPDGYRTLYTVRDYTGLKAILNH